MSSAWCEKSPCEKFNRATFIPARTSRISISGDSDAGPMVATIFVLCSGNAAVMTRRSLFPRAPGRALCSRSGNQRLAWCFVSAHFSAVDRIVPQLFLDAQKLIVFGDAVGAAERTGLYLPGVCRDGDIRDRRVFGLSRAMTDDRGVLVFLRELDGIERLG